jgi:hypothetical protein
MKRGIKLLGEARTEAVLKELHDCCKVMEHKERNKDVTGRQERHTAVSYVSKAETKRSNPRKRLRQQEKERAYTVKEDASLPAMAIKSVMLSCVINAKEHQDVATVDNPAAFMQADMEDLVHMRLEGKMAKLLGQIGSQAVQEACTN